MTISIQNFILEINKRILHRYLRFNNKISYTYKNLQELLLLLRYPSISF